MHDGKDTAATLDRLAILAGRVVDMSSVIVRCGDKVHARHGATVHAAGSSFSRPFPASTKRAGTLELADARRRGPLSASERASLDDLATVISAVLEQDRLAALLAEAADRAVRADSMLRLVTEAPSCTGALTGLLQALCRHHGACVGRIWRLLPDGAMLEESRFNATGLDALPYYHMPPAAPVRAGNSWTARAIQRNEPQAFKYSDVKDPGQYVLLGNAIASGLASQVSFPVWLEEERFGIALAFSTERDDLDAVVADIASLANTIRPALFRKVTEDRVFHLAHHDGLTQLANRTAFNERLRNQVRRAADDGGRFGLLYLDLDGFKAVNDTFGHHMGDKVLVMVAQRLMTCGQEAGRIARLGGDEFAVILPASATDEPLASSKALARTILERFEEPFVLDGRLATVGVSVGIACFPDHGATPDALLRSADVALYECKRSGRRSFRVFDVELAARQRSRSAMREELETAMEFGQLRLSFQPIWQVADRRVVAHEATPYWCHPRRGILPTAEVVQAANMAGLTVPVGHWMLDAACRAAMEWADPLPLSIDVLPGQVSHPGLVAQVKALLESTGLPPGRLDIEVAEQLLVTEADLVRTLPALRDLGVRVTLDGFGTSHAGLGWLRNIAVDRIKLHPSCVADLANPGTFALVHSLVSLGRHLGIDIVAEGADTDARLHALTELGFHLVQGGPAAWSDTPQVGHGDGIHRMFHGDTPSLGLHTPLL